MVIVEKLKVNKTGIVIKWTPFSVFAAETSGTAVNVNKCSLIDGAGVFVCIGSLQTNLLHPAAQCTGLCTYSSSSYSSRTTLVM